MMPLVKLLDTKSFFVKSTGILMVILLLIISDVAMAFKGSKSKEINWYVSGTSGVALLAGEVTKNFVFLSKEFGHRPGFAYDLSVGRNAGNRWEPTFRLGAYTLFGESSLPRFSALGYHEELPATLYNQPVEYITQGSTVSFILRYLIRGSLVKQNKAVQFNPFVEVGAGINNFTSELRYVTIPAAENSPLILRKRNGEYPIGAGQIMTGLGTKIGSYGKWNIVILWNAEWVKYDSLEIGRASCRERV